ncbi:peptidoglycan-binding domain-containing protein [Limnoraphis robusta]|uniref:peptidoglycan-binding domain-containing protein n=1 Tax=Limnoraphis robusta TaxID=1118279 RepID=UPI00069F44E3|nr:peptidoglycan-binding protein [Limnoraphis robusta]
MQSLSIPSEAAHALPKLQLGKTGDDVTYLQSRLNIVGSALKIDGIFGSGTEAAVKRFQKDNNLTIDGIVGPKTWSILLQMTTAPLDNPDGSFPILKAGNTGDSVRELQTRLNNIEANLGIDGVFGPKTVAAVKQFQSKFGLVADGIVGPKTWREILKQEFLYID